MNSAEAPTIPQEIAQLPPSLLYIFAAVTIIWLIAARLSESYENFAKLLGPIGAHFRKSGEKRRKLHQQELQDEAKKQLSELLPTVVPPDVQSIEQSMKNVVDRLNILEENDRIKSAYLIYEEDWHFDDALVRARAGIKYNMVNRLSFPEFQEKYMKGWRPE